MPGAQRVLTPEILARRRGWALSGGGAGSTHQTGHRTCPRCAVSRRASVRPSGLAAQVTLHGRGLGRGRKGCSWGHSGGPHAMLPASSTARDAPGHAGATLVCPARCQPSELPSQPAVCQDADGRGPPLPICLCSQVAPIFRAKASQPGCKQGFGVVGWARARARARGGPPRGSRARSAWLRSQQADEDGLPGWGRLSEEEGQQVCARPPMGPAAPSYR